MWDENYDVVIWFRSLGTQFIAGPSGVVGLNYLVAYKDIESMGLNDQQQDEWKWKMRVMESASIKQFNKGT